MWLISSPGIARGCSINTGVIRSLVNLETLLTQKFSEVTMVKAYSLSEFQLILKPPKSGRILNCMDVSATRWDTRPVLIRLINYGSLIKSSFFIEERHYRACRLNFECIGAFVIK